jgi:hypothetical protein
MRILPLITATILLLSLSGVAFAFMGPEEVGASVNCVVKDITVLARSEYECKAIGGEASQPDEDSK